MFQRELIVDFLRSNILKLLEERRKQGQIRKHTSALQTAMKTAHLADSVQFPAQNPGFAPRTPQTGHGYK